MKTRNFIFIPSLVLLISIVGCEKTTVGSYYIENKTNLSIQVSQKRNFNIIKELNFKPNDKYEFFYSGSIEDIDNLPFSTDTILVKFNDSTFVDTYTLKKSMVLKSEYIFQDSQVNGNQTTKNYVFTINDVYINILRKQIKK